MIGIGIYDGNIFPNLLNVSRDYCNVKYTFNYKRGYHVIYNNNKNERQYISTRIKKNKFIKDNFKLYWTIDEIEKFNETIKNVLASNDYDCLIYLLSCHGDREDLDDVIYDSKGDTVKVATLLNNFSNENCSRLKNRPKIAILDFCRGIMRMNKKINSNFQETVNKNKLQNDNNNNSRKTTNQEKEANNTQRKNSEKKNENNENVFDKKKEKKNNSNNNNNSNNSYVGGFGDFRKVYATLTGYKVIDTAKGGCLIRSFTKVMGYDPFVNTLTLNEILMQTKKVTYNLLGVGALAGATVIDDVDNLTYSLKFQNNSDNTKTYASKEDKKESENESEFKASHIQKHKENSKLANKYKMSNPLIVLLCIGEFNQDADENQIKLDNIIGAKRDCIMAKKCFNIVRGYDIVYMIKHKDKNKYSVRYIHKKGVGDKRTDRFRLHWTEEEIDNFNSQVNQIITKVNDNSKKTSYDGLIYIISGHGNSEDAIYDSEGAKYHLSFIFGEFNNENCQALLNKPKIFIIDTDRGDKEIKLTLNESLKAAKKESSTNPKQEKIEEKEKEKENEKETKNKYENEKTKEIKSSSGININVKSVTHFEKEIDIDSEEIFNQRYYCTDDHFRVIYANGKGYKKIDSETNEKGSYLIRSFTKVIETDEIFCDNTLTDIIIRTKQFMIELINADNDKKMKQIGARPAVNHVIQLIEDCNRMPYHIQFGQPYQAIKERF